MTEEWHDSSEPDCAIVKVQGVPNRDGDGKITRRELVSFVAIAQLFGRKIRDAGQLGEEFLRARVAQETNSAKRTAEEAAELASRREHNEANADLVRQQAVGKFIENVRQISSLSVIEQALALAKIFEENPQIAEQLDFIQGRIEQLNLTRGLVFEQPTTVSAATNPSDQAPLQIDNT